MRGRREDREIESENVRKSEKIWKKNGKVFIARVQRNLPAKKGKKLRDEDGKICLGPPGPRGGKGKELYEYKADHVMPVDVSDKGSGGLDGELYADMWTGKGNYTGTALLEYVNLYGDLTIIQEDGAGGHGYSNKKKKISHPQQSITALLKQLRKWI